MIDSDCNFFGLSGASISRALNGVRWGLNMLDRMYFLSVLLALTGRFLFLFKQRGDELRERLLLL